MEKDVNNADTPAGEDEIRKTDKDSGQQTDKFFQPPSRQDLDPASKTTSGKTPKKIAAHIKQIFKSILRHKKLALIVMIALLAGILILSGAFRIRTSKKVKIGVKNTLTSVKETSYLSSYQTIYSDYINIMNEKDSKKIDYNVAYDAIVKMGFDFDKIQVDTDSANKKVIITIPEIKITDISVDRHSIDYMNGKEKTADGGLLDRFYDACVDDAEKKCAKNDRLLKEAEKNARNIIKGLIDPFGNGDSLKGYHLEIKVAEVKNND